MMYPPDTEDWLEKVSNANAIRALQNVKSTELTKAQFRRRTHLIEEGLLNHYGEITERGLALLVEAESMYHGGV